MKMKLFTLSALSLLTSISWAQSTLLYNSGATVKIEAGAVLYVEGGVHNLMGGTIDNDGTLEIKGNFLNEANWEGSQPNTLKFSGNTASDVTPGTAVFQDVVIQKDAGNNVNLLGTMTVNDSLIFSAPGSTRIVTNDHTLKLGPVAKAAGYDSDEYVATAGGTGLGMMEKTVTAGGTFEFPIGDLTNYSPLTSVHSGTYATANLRARANDLTHPNKPADATEFITRYWDINATGITGYSNTLTGTYVPADLTLGTGGLAAHVKGAVYDGSEWSYVGAAAGTNTVTGTTNDVTADLTGTNFFGKVNLIAHLHGAYNNGTGLMSTTLTSNATIEALMLNSPYTDAPASVGDIPADVTDWVKLELRDVANPATVLGKVSAFVKSNGAVVGLDGTSLPLIKNGNPTSIVGVVHRNHLSIRTPAGLDVLNPTLHDFSLSLANAYDNPANSINDAMKLMPNGKYVMWGGNGNANTTTRYGGPANDRDYLLGTALGGNPTLVLSNVYNPADYNMNGIVRYGGPSNDRDFLLGQVLGANPTLVVTQHQ